MTASVKALAHVVVETTDLQAWVEFGTQLLALQVAEQTSERVLFRMDEYAYRIDVRLSERDGVSAVGWDVKDEAGLQELAERLRAAGHEVTGSTAEERLERQVEGMVRFRDLDGLYDVELVWGKKNAQERFASPLGAEFVASALGVGHLAQVVTDGAAYRALYRDLLGMKLSDYISAHGGAADLEFYHCNPRHHSFAFIEQVPGVTPPVCVAHLMLEVTDIDVVGRGYDKVLEGAAPLRSTFGKHTNDKMLSWYATSPSGFGIEFGCGGLLIDDETWLPTRYDEPHYWGHHKKTREALID